MAHARATGRSVTTEQPSSSPLEEIDSDARMRAQQLSLIYDQALANQFLSPLIAALVSAVLWPVGNPRMLSAWVAVLSGISLWRHLLASAYRKAATDAVTVRLWERRFVVSLAVASAAWGVGSLLNLPALPNAYQAFVYCFVLGMAAGAAAIYAAHGPSVAVGMALIMGPATVFMFTVGDAFHTALGAGGAVFLVAGSRGVRTMNGALRRTIQLSGELARLARTDVLSGLSNRRAFTEFGELALANAVRSARPCAIVMIDIDRFKAINDRHGHAAGDAVIRALGAALAGAIRVGECAGRIGGEEFAVFLPDAGSDQGMALAHRVQALVRAMRTRAGDVPVEVTASIGVASTHGVPCTFEELLARADKEMYRAKHEGGNRVVLADDARPATVLQLR